MSTVTLGVKVDEALRERLKQLAESLGCTPHWLHKQALITYIEAIERGQLPADIDHRLDPDTSEVSGELDPQSPFYAFAQEIQPQSVLRSAITAAYRRPEPECVAMLLDQAEVGSAEPVRTLATRLVQALRDKRTGGGVEGVIQEFSLSSQEGVALMCLAEALLRIPDRATRDALIRDKISRGDWKAHVGESQSLFVNAATWGLLVTGKLVGVHSEQNLSRALTRLIAKGGEPLIRRGVNMAMRLMGEQFVAGQTIASALANGRKLEDVGFRYSYDMLGEAATTAEDAAYYYKSYQQAIHAIGKSAQGRGIYEGPGISIKLSALHPRYARAQRDRAMSELLPRMLDLAVLARHYDIGLNIDAEEADRLELSLDLLEAMCFDERLRGWNGIGFVVQAYQKRCPFVIDFLIDLARRSKHRLMVRLVKGAYWDSEIKRAQVDGLEGYPVYTRKVHTDVSYLACARKLLSAPEAVFPQFATHNAQTMASIYYLAGENYYPGQYEFQCLHGMGEALYEEVVGPVSKGRLNRPCRIYAPVGTHETLLAYLVRRLLENGANTSFVNQIGDKNVPIDALIADPVSKVRASQPLGAPHDRIPLPRDLYQARDGRLNSAGMDLSNEHRLGSLAAALLASSGQQWQAAPPGDWDPARARSILNPADHRDQVGMLIEAEDGDVQAALRRADYAAPIWASTPVTDRAQCLRHAAQIMEAEMQTTIGLIVREAGKSFPNAVSEVREAVDFLRYYAARIEAEFSNDTHRPLGPVLCISPWNFPLAIFTGQISAALAAGNVVLAKPAEQTNLIAAYGVSVLHRAGVPAAAVQLLPGQGETVGAALVASPVIRGVMFTGSTEVAKLIATTLAQRLDATARPVPLIAETGGQNALIVDSSALTEQVVYDVLSSAFDSAGQRCSALRVLCVQEDCADRTITMLRGALQELRVGRPELLSTDIGPVIDAQAQAVIEKHVAAMQASGHRVARKDLDAEQTRHGTFVAPTLIEISDVGELEREVFGPVLHVLRYPRKDLDHVIDEINGRGYGLTFGVHTRLDETVHHVTDRIHAGNIYVNRNIVGATVGVQPFGGEGLSGTGPKAGGPLYLHRLVASGSTDLPVEGIVGASRAELELPGPTGESNTYRLKPRGVVLCQATTPTGAHAQREACRRTGNAMLCVDSASARALYQFTGDGPALDWVASEDVVTADYQAVLFEGDGDDLLHLTQLVAGREGPIIPVIARRSDELANGIAYPLEMLVREVSVCINTAAAGGNATLMMVG
ncbi:MAG: trifunctional transcriptional regulator/proline dehydrogenase/L-glutamate gamma-semialdehyde dehydrogenase [Castellaniella sp.]|uniref:trifunctional transcriptional regulator/proline dehydrogenase/L-glutamate gamma-semialdehyde dehydrogenase n=1 Tax=Castellaniella sp. TaxID=1955812 RepID=UPI001228D56F|nr:trifunctional transcriptional regulator/proline dehydrogenase/L-glutamate gamma-semialdehyde dehydrogenase [Castellaniella sp.]TAN27791.1 MAG: trifunctional transcriptional regulator/proline dehydrogenase/L-glutamate gamma-semialdehyde dehydrogenase [Castellaniella sp.]